MGAGVAKGMVALGRLIRDVGDDILPVRDLTQIRITVRRKTRLDPGGVMLDAEYT